MEDLIQQYIESLENLDSFPSPPDENERIVDNALAQWLCQYFPNGFPFSQEQRDAMVTVLREARKVQIGFPLHVYIDAILYSIWNNTENPLAAMRASFTFGAMFSFLTNIFEKKGEDDQTTE